MNFNDDDIFKRENIADNITKILMTAENYRDESLVIAINSAWGTGKTIFIDQWKNKLLDPEIIPNSKIYPISYNAWENDDWENAFSPILSALHEHFDDYFKDKALSKTMKEGLKKQGIMLATTLTKGFLKSKGIDVETLSDLYKSGTATYDEFKSNLDVPFLEEFKIYSEVKSSFTLFLEDFVDKSGQTLVIIIDELDRCKPIFAIETLEIIKHFFNTKKVVFVLALDIEQLKHSIATVYGHNMDSEGYLRRFIDLEFSLPEPPQELFIDYCIKLDPQYVTIVESIFSKLSLSLRDIKKIINNIHVFHTIYADTMNIHFFEYFTTLISLRHKHYDYYMTMINYNLKSNKEDKKLLEKSLEDYITDNVFTLVKNIKLDKSVQHHLDENRIRSVQDIFLNYKKSDRNEIAKNMIYRTLNYSIKREPNLKWTQCQGHNKKET